MSLSGWEQLIKDGQNWNDIDKLRLVNMFFNKIPYVSDMAHYGVDDKWATPLELLNEGGGDCEDYSIAKFFTLLEMGVPEEKLSILYCKSITLNEYHMVLLYDVGHERLVLDNYTPNINSLFERTDLLPVYSFNTEDVWVYKNGERILAEGKAVKLGKWQEILRRYKSES